MSRQIERLDSKEEEFMRELYQLTMRTGIAVDGCGCCGSPSLTHVDTGDTEGYHLDEGGMEISWGTSTGIDARCSKVHVHQDTITYDDKEDNEDETDS